MAYLKRIFLFPRWDMLVSWRVRLPPLWDDSWLKHLFSSLKVLSPARWPTERPVVLVDGANAGSRRDNKTSTPPLQVEWFSKFCWSDVAWICPSKIECICFGLVLDDWHVNDPQFKGNKVKSTQVYTLSTMQCPRLIVEGSHVQHVAPWECLGSDDLRVGEWYLWSPPLWLTFIGADFFWPSKIFDPPKVPQFLATAKSESYLFNLRSMGGF